MTFFFMGGLIVFKLTKKSLTSSMKRHFEIVELFHERYLFLQSRDENIFKIAQRIDANM